ncbi:hypothetical protein D2T31_10870 [Sinirhodobacter populi]|uniref:Arc family DNA-binding protein n=1 Tax=Paenirhodobacter populi TaxID=2306993 RepID=A0A443K9R1_9RHOB|nr:hypothetical protein [Sinirhodobacter populi]RWR29475.1 hypothetical protein D2T31_10870 [Sinirhodobacter populi]
MLKTIQGRAEGDIVVTTIRLPRKLRDEMKIQAIRAGRSFNTHVAVIFEEAAGGNLGGTAPAAEMSHNSIYQEAHHHDGE